MNESELMDSKRIQLHGVAIESQRYREDAEGFIFMFPAESAS